MIELQQLRQLIAAAEHETLTAAAESLYISHLTLSRSIRKLEKELGGKLFGHSQNRICLNENGNAAVEEARKVVGQLERLESASANAISASARFRLHPVRQAHCGRWLRC